MAEQIYYIVETHENGRVWFEGYRSEQNAIDRANTQRDWYAKINDKTVVEYVGTELPEPLKAQQLEDHLKAYEQEFKMQPLQGSEKQVAWARQIRVRYAEYLDEKFGEKALQKFEKDASQTQASYWIDHRYGFTTTNSDPGRLYIAEGQR